MYRNTYCEVNLQHIVDNYKYLQKISNSKVIGVVKGNAYGHGIIEVATALVEAGIECLGVATFDEAIYLRSFIDEEIDILLMGHCDIDVFTVAVKKNISIAISNYEQLKYVPKEMKIHLNFNTGMNRLGMRDHLKCLQFVRQRELNLEGVFTHFGTADHNDAYYSMQVFEFKQILKSFENMNIKYVHAQNSASLLLENRLLPGCNTVRIGLGLYGMKCNEIIFSKNLKPALSLYSYVSAINFLKKGDFTSYDARYIAQKDEIVATVAIGYADGIIRANSGREVVIKNKRYPIIGRICMDQLIILIDENVMLNDRVELLGENISVDEVASYLKTINYEVTTIISKRVMRKYINNK